jgi:hypothetical protein
MLAASLLLLLLSSVFLSATTGKLSPPLFFY